MFYVENVLLVHFMLNPVCFVENVLLVAFMLNHVCFM